MINVEKIEVKPCEQVFNWEGLSVDQQNIVVIVHAMAARVQRSILMPLFNLGNPKIVFGAKFDYCRIHPESVDVMKVILNEYL